jgi:hypothetical protein
LQKLEARLTQVPEVMMQEEAEEEEEAEVLNIKFNILFMNVLF